MSFFYNKEGDEYKVAKIITCIMIFIFLISFMSALLHPLYNVWSKGLSGKAELKEAEWNRQIATLDAQAEVERAKGVAEANRIIADGLKGNEEYLRYLWIQELDKSNVVYVPTEANLPILEARDK